MHEHACVFCKRSDVCVREREGDVNSYTCCIWMCLRDGLEREGGVPEDTQGGVHFSPSDTCGVQAETTGIGLEGKNELNLIFPLLLSSERYSTWSLPLVGWLSFVLLCSSRISRSDVGPLEIFAPPHAGPSLLGVGGGAASLGASSRAPLRNIESPPFFFFFFNAVELLHFGNSKISFFCMQKGDSLVTWLVGVPSNSASPSYQMPQFQQIKQNFQIFYFNFLYFIVSNLSLTWNK